MGQGNSKSQETQIEIPLYGKNDALANLDDYLYDRYNREKYQSTAINHE